VIKLNCDLGESFGAWTLGLDAQAMKYIDQANIACGFHAGIMWRWAHTLVIQILLVLAVVQ
jgi:lactam utilization protein B